MYSIFVNNSINDLLQQIKVDEIILPFDSSYPRDIALLINTTFDHNNKQSTTFSELGDSRESFESILHYLGSLFEYNII